MEQKYSQIMTPKQAAKYLDLHPITVYRLIKKVNSLLSK